MKFRDMRTVKKQLNKGIINGIINYALGGELPKNNKADAYMNAYSLVQNLSDEGNPESAALFTFHNSTISDFVRKCSDKLELIPDSQLIDNFIKLSENINFVAYWLSRIFTYLDRFYTKSQQDKKSLSKTSLEIYRNDFFVNVQGKIFKEVNKLIEEDRKGNIEQRHKIKAILKIIDDMEIHNPKIIKENNKICWVSEKSDEKKNEIFNENGNKTFADKWYSEYFKSDTEEFARKKANIDIHSMSAPEYIESTLQFLEEEKTRQKEYINPKYHNRINEINYYYLIANVAEELSKMETSIKYMFEYKKKNELSQAYKLFINYPDSIKYITEKFGPYIRQRGLEIYENKEIMRDPRKFIPQLISLKKEMDDLVIQCFDNNLSFQDTKNKAFSQFMGKEHYAKQLSNYTDFCMRNGFKGKSDEVIENELNEIIGLFKCLSNKIVFQIEANKKTSDRLIQGRSLSLNAEKSLISKLKQEAGVNYVTKLTEMMNDLEKNRGENEIYVKNSPSQGKPNGIKFNVTVISQSAWEINKKHMEHIELPAFMQNCIEEFQNFYLQRHSGHKLLWCLGLSKIEIKYLALNKPYISNSTLIQFITLLMLERFGKLTLRKLSDLLGCNISTIINDMSGLVYNPSFNKKGESNKGIILGNFDEKSKEFKEGNEIYLNTKFTNNTLKFSTLSLTTKKSEKEVKETELEEAQITRKYQDNILQATLTRIMKSRIGQKTTHVWLIGEAAKQIDYFRAQPQQIKENIEKLIEKGIIKRGQNDRTCYEYIAYNNL